MTKKDLNFFGSDGIILVTVSGTTEEGSPACTDGGPRPEKGLWSHMNMEKTSAEKANPAGVPAKQDAAEIPLFLFHSGKNRRQNQRGSPARLCLHSRDSTPFQWHPG